MFYWQSLTDLRGGPAAAIAEVQNLPSFVLPGLQGAGLAGEGQWPRVASLQPLNLQDPGLVRWVQRSWGTAAPTGPAHSSSQSLGVGSGGPRSLRGPQMTPPPGRDSLAHPLPLSAG